MRTYTTRKGIRVTGSQAAVYDVLSQHGPMTDAALVPLTQHVAQSHQSSSGIRTRRRELQRLGLVKDAESNVKMPSGRTAVQFEVIA